MLLAELSLLGHLTLTEGDCCNPNPMREEAEKASLVAQLVKNLPAMRDLSSIPGLGRSRGGVHGNPLQVLLPGEFH